MITADMQDMNRETMWFNLFTMGTMITEALKASDQLLEKGIYGNVIVVSSPNLLVRGDLAQANDFYGYAVLNLNGDLHLVPNEPK